MLLLGFAVNARHLGMRCQSLLAYIYMKLVPVSFECCQSVQEDRRKQRMELERRVMAEHGAELRIDQ